MDKKDFRIIFMGTPEFAVPSLSALLGDEYNVVAVITSADKPAGRGLKIRESPVKVYSSEQKIKILQPENLKDPGFLLEIKELKPDLQIVVGFRKLPKEVWGLPQNGTVNLHASLLPDYRGAAPISRAIINGEKETGATTFFIEEEIDTGKIIFQETVEIKETDNAEDLHDKLATTGAGLVLKTVHAIMQKNFPQIDQEGLSDPLRKPKRAPKITKEDCRINWSDEPVKIFNLIRGLSPYPAAWTEIVTGPGKKSILKIFSSTPQIADHSFAPGVIDSDQKIYLRVAVIGGYLNIFELQIEGKKRMPVSEFLRGFRIEECRMV